MRSTSERAQDSTGVMHSHSSDDRASFELFAVELAVEPGPGRVRNRHKNSSGLHVSDHSLSLIAQWLVKSRGDCQRLRLGIL